MCTRLPLNYNNQIATSFTEFYPLYQPIFYPHYQQQQQQQQQQFAQRMLPDRRTNEWSISPPGPRLHNVNAKLHNEKLWQQFHKETTEMIITKTGRRMFPPIQLNINGLQKHEYYYILVEMTLNSSRRHKYTCHTGETDEDKKSTRGNWTTAGPAEQQPHLDRRIFLHPDSPALGEHWMLHFINFSKLKVTNNVGDQHNHVLLTSMHKYIPKIWIFRCQNAKNITELYRYPSVSFVFEETEFIAVTAYQNEKITQLKINHNPFAKGFRDTGQSRSKRKSLTNANEWKCSTSPTLEENSEDDLDLYRDAPYSSDNRSPRLPKATARLTDDITTTTSDGNVRARVETAGQTLNPTRDSETGVERKRLKQREGVPCDESSRIGIYHRPWLDSTRFNRTTSNSSSMASSNLASLSPSPPSLPWTSLSTTVQDFPKSHSHYVHPPYSETFPLIDIIDLRRILIPKPCTTCSYRF